MVSLIIFGGLVTVVYVGINMESDVCSVGKNCEPYRDVKGIVLSVLAQVMSLCFV